MFYFVLPIYNEKDNLESLIASLRRLMAGKAYRIVAVNDGSTDGSLDILNRLSGPDLVVTGSVINMNVGAVFSTGISEALKGAGDEDVLFIMESDQTSELDLILPMAEKIEKNEADIVIASRYLSGGGYRNFPAARMVFSHGANRLMRYYFPVAGVRDYTIFFRAYRMKLLKDAVRYFGPFGLIQSKGFVANAELLIKLSLFTSKIAEVPFIYNYGRKKGGSKLQIFSTINEYFVLINYLKLLFRKHRSLA